MADPLVLRLPRTDVDGDFVLVNVLQSGPDPLDLKLIATDGEAPFVRHIRQKAIHKLLSSSSSSDSDRWPAILSSVLLRSISDGSTMAGVEAVANLSDSQLTITIRNKISGITQRLGAITLDRDEDESVQLYDWAGSAVSRADGLAHQLASFQSTITEHQKKIDELTAQLDDLVRAKKSHQDEMLRKCAALLNAKKLKIRDQQRLLANAKVDSNTAALVEQARSATGRKPEISRSSKRKINDKTREVETDDDDTEMTTSGNRMDEEDQELEESVTPEKSDLDTDDDVSDGGFAPAPMPSQTSRSQMPAGAKARSMETIERKEEAVTMPDMSGLQPPPRRHLPFSNKSDQSTTSQTNLKPSPAISSQPPPKSSSPPQVSTLNTPSVLDDEETDDEL